MINPFTELQNAGKKEEHVKQVQTSKFSNYITIGLKFPKYKKYHMYAFVGSGLGYTLAKRYAIPDEYWEKALRAVTGIAMGEHESIMNTMARNVNISLGGENFICKIIWQYHSEILSKMESEDYESREEFNFPESDLDSLELESSDGEEQYIREHNLKVPAIAEIENFLKPVISEDPQLYWDKDMVYCQLKMHDANTICHVKAIPHYSEEDRKKMENQIQELLEKRLIRHLNSLHHTPAFLVRNHVEHVKGKARMVIDYIDVNKKPLKTVIK
ncbi:uncharacterized protein LOC126797099 [Argentina anserina]|uniref:uncharacterized protein LOC126797099 n=1 Tax=Argentina anserina TaxID=57926 RepID=UPI0021762568|nr:uncharacterized protein LOC126797099 [Potentilla anserina]